MTNRKRNRKLRRKKSNDWNLGLYLTFFWGNCCGYFVDLFLCWTEDLWFWREHNCGYALSFRTIVELLEASKLPHRLFCLFHAGKRENNYIILNDFHHYSTQLFGRHDNTSHPNLVYLWQKKPRKYQLCFDFE